MRLLPSMSDGSPNAARSSGSINVSNVTPNDAYRRRCNRPRIERIGDDDRRVRDRDHARPAIVRRRAFTVGVGVQAQDLPRLLDYSESRRTKPATMLPRAAAARAAPMSGRSWTRSRSRNAVSNACDARYLVGKPADDAITSSDALAEGINAGAALGDAVPPAVKSSVVVADDSVVP